MKKFKIEVIGYVSVVELIELETDSRGEAEAIAIERFNDDNPEVTDDMTEILNIQEVSS